MPTNCPGCRADLDKARVDIAGLLKNTAGGQANVSYTAGTPGNWSGAAPTTVQAALDRIASAVHTLLGAPIP